MRLLRADKSRIPTVDEALPDTARLVEVHLSFTVQDWNDLNANLIQYVPARFEYDGTIKY